MELDDFERDLRPFADPATDLESLGDAKTFQVKMVRNGADLVITLDRASGKVGSKFQSEPRVQKFASFRSLLASDLFADTKHMAHNQRVMLADFMAQPYIQPEGRIADLPIDQESFDSASSLKLGESNAKPIKLMLIDGPAGVGKTSLIKRLVAQRAFDYGQSADKPVILHVANRGRRLANLDDLIAHSIQLIRAEFTYDQVPTLIRNGVIQIAIDGFDELVDADGYADTWSVLKEFLSEVKSGGPILLAGRDTFFDLSGFQDKLEHMGSQTSITHVRLSSIKRKAATDWLIKCGWTETDVNTDEVQDLLREDSYALRPFFLSEIAKPGGIQSLRDELINPREFLVRRFLDREAKLITEKVSLSEPEAVRLLRDLFELIAIEMAEAETEAVDIPFLQLAVDDIFSEPLSNPADLAKLRHKSGSFALMEKDARSEFRRFPHTEILNHFLASALLKRLLKNNTPRFLRRGYFGPDLMSILGDSMLTIPVDDVISIRAHLVDVTRSEVGFERLSENACSVAIQSLVVNAIEQPLKLSSLSAGEIVLFGTAGAAELKDINISRLDARSADLKAISFKDCQIATLLIDNSTEFGDAPPTAHVLMGESDGRQDILRDPKEITARIAQKCPPKASDGGNTEAVDLLQKIVRVFMRQFYIKDSDPELEGRYLADAYWLPIEEILTETGRLRRNRKDAAGSRGDFIHIVNAASLLTSATPEDRNIWKKVAAIPPRA